MIFWFVFFSRKEYISRMNFIKYITMILLSLEPSYSDKETWDERTARMEIIATAIDDASSKATCSDKYNTPGCEKSWPSDKKSIAMLLVTKGFWESKFAKNVHEGKCRLYECDAYKINGNVRHKARSPWQIQRTGLVSKEEYDKMTTSSLESTTMSANVAVRYLSVGMKSCKTIRGAMSIYGGAKVCNWSGVAPREAFYKKISALSDEQIFAAADARKIKHNAKNDKVFATSNKK